MERSLRAKEVSSCSVGALRVESVIGTSRLFAASVMCVLRSGTGGSGVSLQLVCVLHRRVCVWPRF